ncbi:MAG: hypothetical protein CL878_09195 [Dehalococcoidia bacterium]|nr:hypothetical protein [Dehalococcoidia bacterium]
MTTGGLAARLRLGWLVFVGLLVLTVGEYIALLVTPPVALWRFLLVVLQVADAGLILWYFMHMGQLWRPGEE